MTEFGELKRAAFGAHRVSRWDLATVVIELVAARRMEEAREAALLYVREFAPLTVVVP